MNRIKIIKRAIYWLIKNPWLFLDNIICQIPSILPDSLFLKLRFRCNIGYPLNLKHPHSYNEKLQWLKLYDKHSEYTNFVDKYEVKQYISKIIGDEYLIPTIGIWDKPENIEWEKLPNQFVIKPTGDSGSVVVCKNKSQFDIKDAIVKLNKYGSRTYSEINKEYPYKDVPHRYIAEAYIEDESGYELKDYKFFCFHGKPKLLYVASGRHNKDLSFDFFDLEFNHLPFENGHKNATITPKRPKNFGKMIELAEKLSKPFVHVRVDLYNVNGRIYFGELTFFHMSGLYPFIPRKWDYIIGDYLHLPIKKDCSEHKD